MHLSRLLLLFKIKDSRGNGNLGTKKILLRTRNNLLYIVALIISVDDLIFILLTSECLSTNSWKLPIKLRFSLVWNYNKWKTKWRVKKTVKCSYLYLLNNSKEMLTSKFKFYLFNFLLYQFSWIYSSLIEHYTTLGYSGIKDGCLKLDILFVLCWFWNYTLTIIKCFIYYIWSWVCVSFRFFL